MSALAIGDRVLAASAGSGALEYQDIYMFGHADAEAGGDYVSVATAGGRVLRLSPDHYLPVCAAAEGWHAHRTILAGRVAAGMQVWVASHEAPGSMRPDTVTSVTVSPARGLFNPYTMGGYIVVDGVVASAHSASGLDQAFAALGIDIPTGYQVGRQRTPLGKGQCSTCYMRAALTDGTWCCPAGGVCHLPHVLPHRGCARRQAAPRHPGQSFDHGNYDLTDQLVVLRHNDLVTHYDMIA